MALVCPPVRCSNSLSLFALDTTITIRYYPILSLSLTQRPPDSSVLYHGEDREVWCHGGQLGLEESMTIYEGAWAITRNGEFLKLGQLIVNNFL